MHQAICNRRKQCAKPSHLTELNVLFSVVALRDASIGMTNKVKRTSCLMYVGRDQIQEAFSLIAVTNWRRRARIRGAWKNVLRQAESFSLGRVGGQLSNSVAICFIA